MGYIYRPKGKAEEYGELALNHYRGCGHGCLYCYVPPILYQTPEQFHANPQPRKLDQKILDKELEAWRGKSVFLCFTCDPYQPIDSDLKITREIIQRFQSCGVSPNILTKGGPRSTRDFDLLASDPKSQYGATLTFLNPEDSLKWEPGAALPQERIDALKQAHGLGIRTWASLEPVVDPEQSLEIIRETHGFADEFKIGRWNHDPDADKIDWKSFGQKALALCESLEKSYYVKKDLAVFLKA
jgi:DNA repair photolyase